MRVEGGGRCIVPCPLPSPLHPVRNVIIILGPTASGKSTLGVRMARRFAGVVISADSRQVYRGYDLGSGKVTKRARHGVPHFLIDVASIRRQYTAGDFARDFQRVLAKLDPATPIFLVGGSPFYIEAALDPGKLAGVKPDPKLRARLEKKTTATLVKQFRRCDPKRAATIDPHNRRRLIRAIEVASSKSPHHLQPTTYNPTPLRILKLGLSFPRRTLYARIDRRVDERMRRGMLQETERLHARGASWKRLESLGLEARFLSYAVRGQMTKAEAVERLKGRIHAFARRQLTWWRRDKTIRWIRTPAQAALLVRRFLQR